VFLLLAIPLSLPRVFGRMIGDLRQGHAILAVMVILAVTSVAAANYFQLQADGTVPAAVGAATEGTETRFGISQSATFAAATTLTSTGAVNSFHDSYTALGGMVPIANMMLGEVAPGGTGSGLYGMLVLAVITVFVAGLMVGRTPEYVGKKIRSREIKFASLYFLSRRSSSWWGRRRPVPSYVGQGVHVEYRTQASKCLCAHTSASNNNCSAFAGISVNTVWYNTSLGLAMLFGRFLPIVLVLGLAGSLGAQGESPVTAGTLRTHQPLFVGMLAGVTIILVALTFLPALALGPLAEGL
jgi:K+-transporting ATPase ATPase A chain